MLSLLLVASTLADEPAAVAPADIDAERTATEWPLPFEIRAGDLLGRGTADIDRGRTTELLLTPDGLLQLTPSGVAVLRDPATLAVLADVLAPAPIADLAPDPPHGTLLLDRAGDIWRWTRDDGVTPSGLASLAGLPLWNGIIDGRRLFVVSTPKGVDIVHPDGHRVPMWLTPGVIHRRAYRGHHGMWLRPPRPLVGERYVESQLDVYGAWKGRLYFQGDENHYWCVPRNGVLHVVRGGNAFAMLGLEDRLFAYRGEASTSTTAPEMWGWYGPFGDMTNTAINRERVEGAWLDGDRIVLTTESGALWAVDRSKNHWQTLAADPDPAISSDRATAAKVPDGLVVATHGRLWHVGGGAVFSTARLRHDGAREPVYPDPGRGPNGEYLDVIGDVGGRGLARASPGSGVPRPVMDTALLVASEDGNWRPLGTAPWSLGKGGPGGVEALSGRSDVLFHRAFRSSDDGSLLRWTDASRTSLERVPLPFSVVAAASAGDDLLVLSRTGAWLVDPRKWTLDDLHLPSGVARRDGLVAMDRCGRAWVAGDGLWVRGDDATWRLASADPPLHGRRWEAMTADGSRLVAIADETEFRLDVPCQ